MIIKVIILSMLAEAIWENLRMVWENGNWEDVSKVYKKENGSWVEQQDLSQVFDVNSNYIKEN